MAFTTNKKMIIIWVSACLMVFCSAWLMYTKADRKAQMLNLRNTTDSLMLLTELASESGDDYTNKVALFKELMLDYTEHMKQRNLHWLIQLPPFSKKNVAKELKRAAEYLADDRNPSEAIEKASKSISEFLNESKPFTGEPIVTSEPEAISQEIRDALRNSLVKVHEKAEIYSNDASVANSASACMANRRAIIYLYLARFGYEEIVSQDDLKKFRTDLNRTIYYNQFLQKTDAIKGGTGIYDSDYSRLDRYSISELRRLRLLQAIIDKDFLRVQILLQIAIKNAIPDGQFSTVPP